LRVHGRLLARRPAPAPPGEARCGRASARALRRSATVRRTAGVRPAAAVVRRAPPLVAVLRTPRPHPRQRGLIRPNLGAVRRRRLNSPPSCWLPSAPGGRRWRSRLDHCAGRSRRSCWPSDAAPTRLRQSCAMAAMMNPPNPGVRVIHGLPWGNARNPQDRAQMCAQMCARPIWAIQAWS
jgi:hypothetical protein